ncbi:MAG TPA: hypothetical protein VF040_17625 [Ktedonobacterales bacterium]
MRRKDANSAGLVFAFWYADRYAVTSAQGYAVGGGEKPGSTAAGMDRLMSFPDEARTASTRSDFPRR